MSDWITQASPNYPVWVCFDCATKRSRNSRGRNTVMTWHKDKCGVCGKKVMVTEPRDFSYPDLLMKRKKG